MRDLPRLMDAVYDAYLNAIPATPRNRWAPIVAGEQITTFCNEVVNSVCKRFGFKGFDLSTEKEPFKAKLANDQIDIMNINPTVWRRVPNANAAQNLSNAGALVIACNKKPDGHGHVAIVIPGNIEFSNNWQEVAPKLMNVGKDVFIGKKASFAFNAIEKPSYFVLEA